MTGREWKPGDVAMVNGLVCIKTSRGWEHGSERAFPFAHGDPSLDIRPLVVLDPDSIDDANLLAKVIVEAAYKQGNLVVSDNGISPLTTAAALYALVNPTNKPEEPTGLGAVVEDADGERWISFRVSARHELPWIKHMSDPEEWADYTDIAAVKVLSEGVTA